MGPAWTSAPPARTGVYLTRVRVGDALVEEDPLVVLVRQGGERVYARDLPADGPLREWCGPLWRRAEA